MLQEKRIKLLKEIDFAQDRLRENINSFEPSDLLQLDNGSMSKSIVSGIASQGISMSNIEKMSKLVLPRNNYVHSIIKLIRLFSEDKD